jgi:hypothetical protein
MGFRTSRLWFPAIPLSCHPNYRALTFTLAGLSPAEHTSLSWLQPPHQLISGRARAQTKVPHATLRGQKGAPRRMGPIFRTASCSHAPGRSRIHLGLVCTSRQSSRLHALISLSERWPLAPLRFPGIATRRSKAYVPWQRWRCAGCGPLAVPTRSRNQILNGLLGR